MGYPDYATTLDVPFLYKTLKDQFLRRINIFKRLFNEFPQREHFKERACERENNSC